MNKHHISGSNVYLSIIDEKELKTIFEWKNDYDLLKLINAHPSNNNMYELYDWFDRNQSDKNQFMWGIHEMSSGHIIGIVRLMFIDWISSVAEFGMYIGEKSYRGKGLGKEVLNLTLDFAFNKINMHRIYLKVDNTNNTAVNLYISCGFKKEGLLRDHFWREGEYTDILIMGILKNDRKS